MSQQRPLAAALPYLTGCCPLLGVVREQMHTAVAQAGLLPEQPRLIRRRLAGGAGHHRLAVRLEAGLGAGAAIARCVRRRPREAVLDCSKGTWITLALHPNHLRCLRASMCGSCRAR